MEKVIQPVFYISWALWLLYSYIFLLLQKKEPVASPSGTADENGLLDPGRADKKLLAPPFSKRWVSFIGMFLSTIAIFSLFFLLTQDFKSDSNFFIENYEYKITGQQKEIIIGSSEEGADITLENASAAERHLKIILKGTEFEVQDISDDKKVDINGRYLNQATLKVGDVIEINGKEKIKVLKINSQYPLGRSITVSITRSGKKETPPVTLRTLLNKTVTIGETGAASLEYAPNKRFLGTSIYYVIVFFLVILLCAAIYFYLQNRFNGALLLLMMVSLAFGAGFVPAGVQGVIMLLFLPCIVYVGKKRKTRWNRGSLLVIFLYGCVFVSPMLLRMGGDFTLDYAHFSRKDAASIRVIPAGANEASFELFDKREKLDYGRSYEVILGHTRYVMRVDYTGVSFSPRDPEKIRISRDFFAITGDLSEVRPGNNYVYLKFPHDFESVPANAVTDKEKIRVSDAKGNGIMLSKTMNENYRIYLFGLIFVIVGPFWIFWGLNDLHPLDRKGFLKKQESEMLSARKENPRAVQEVGDAVPLFEKKRPKSFCLFNYKSFIVYNLVYFLLGIGYVVFGGLALYNNSYFKNFAKFRVSALPLFVGLFLGLLLISRYNRFLVFLSRLLRQRKYQVPLLVLFILLMASIYSMVFLAAAALFFIFVFGFRLRKVIVFEYKSAHSYPLDVKKFMETPVCSFEDKENRRLFFGLGGLLNKQGWNYLLIADLLLLLALFFIVLQTFLGGELGISVGGFLFFPIELGKILLAIYFADWVSRIDKGMEFSVLWVYGLVLAPFILLIVFLKDFSPLLIFVFVFLYHIIKIKKSLFVKLLLIVSALVMMKQAVAALNNYTLPVHSFAVLFSIAILFILLRVWSRKKQGAEPRWYINFKKILATLVLVSLLGAGNYVLRYGHLPVSRVLGDRVSLWLNPWQDYNLSYQYINSLWLMKGTGAMGNAADALTAAARVPVVEKDLSFALYVSTLGTAGIVLLLLTIFLAAGVVFRRGGSAWHGYVMEFLAVIFIAQFLVPAMYTVGLLPLMGQPLPFLSYSNNNLLLFALPFSFLMFILSTENNQNNEKFWEVQEPFFKRVPGRRRHHFLIFCLIIMLIALVFLLRLYSISYPKDIEEKTDIVYLESFHDYGSIFKINLKGRQFFLAPLVKRIEVNGKEFAGDIDIHNGDIIGVGDNRFQFKVYPGEYLYKEIFCRPVRSLFPGPASVQYIGGWPDADRRKVLANARNRELLKKTIVEIAPEEFKKLMPGLESSVFGGAVLELRWNSNTLQVRPFVSGMARIRELDEKKVEKDSVIPMAAGDILKICPSLYIKFDYRRVEGLQNLVISYRQEQNYPFPPEPEAAILKSLDTGIAYDINLSRETHFMGKQGLFSFNLAPGELMDKLYIPEKVPQGRVVDLKELLDRKMYYRKDRRFFAVTVEFLENVRTYFKKGPEALQHFFDESNIKWRSFKNYPAFESHVNKAEFLIHKMENKGIYKAFINEIEKLDNKPGQGKREDIGKVFQVKNNKIYLVQKQAHRPSFRKATSPQKPMIVDAENNFLAYSSEINGAYRRFYATEVPPDLLSLLGGKGEETWALEQIFSRLYRENRIHDIRLTFNLEWQKIALAAMRKMLLENRETELNNPKYLGLRSEYEEVKAQLAQSGEKEVSPLRKRLRELKKEIDLEKNRFYEASVVLLDPVGRILVAASYPYDEATLQELNPELPGPYRRDTNPHLNRTWKWKYNPGSTAKILDSIAFLSSRERFPYLQRLLTSGNAFAYFPRTDLKGSMMLNGKEILFRLRNFQGHDIPSGFCSLVDAFTHSYNTYFAYLALHDSNVLTVDSQVYTHSRSFIKKSTVPISEVYREYPVLEYAERLLMNRKLNLLSNLSGTPIHDGLQRMPNDALITVESVFPVNAYTAADIAHYAIGQGDFQLTALQNALTASSILNNGALYFPSIIESVRLREPDNQPGQAIIPDPEKSKIQVFPAYVAGEIKGAMQAVTVRGTAGGVFGDLMKGRVFYAKTGTAETGFSKDNALFTGFVKFRNNEYVVFSVIVPRSGLGARIAGKLTVQIMADIIEYENKKGNPL